MDLLSLPVVMIENVFSFLTYDEIAKNRMVCRTFNDICMRMLNRGFVMIERRHGMSLKSVKGQLPRRESERRYHPLARHCDILSSIETRISMLNMTYSKFIDRGLCCFIPGKVIDEIKRVLALVESSQTPPRAHEVLQELRDISSMAIEHFDDKISPAFRRQLQANVAVVRAPPVVNDAANPFALKQEILYIRRRLIINERLSLHLVSRYKKYYKRMIGYKRLALKQRQTIQSMSQKQNDQENAIADLKKRIEECDIKYSELTHTNQAVGGKVITASPTSDVSVSSQPLRHFASQIKLDLSVLPIGTGKRSQGKLVPNMKPRKPVIKLPSLSEDITQLQTSDKPTEDQTTIQPSTSQDKPKTKSPLATIEKYEREIKSLSRQELTPRLGKRSISLTLDSFPTDLGVKKPKID